MHSEFTNSERAEAIVQALPYIKRFNGKIIVVKYGGNAMINEKLKMQVMQDIALLQLIGVKIVLVHGGGPEINDIMNRLGKEAVFVDGLRVTDKETMDIVQMVLAGKVNKSLVTLLQKKGGHAVGLSGMDGGIIEARIKDDRLGWVGEITKIRTKPITDLLDMGYIPVITSIGADENGVTYNINADTMACYVASAVKAENIILMTDIRGLLENKDDENTLITSILTTDVEPLIEKGIIAGGMIPKLKCCVDTINSGVSKAAIIDGRIMHAILIEMLSDEGIGTMFVKGEEY